MTSVSLFYELSVDQTRLVSVLISATTNKTYVDHTNNKKTIKQKVFLLYFLQGQYMFAI